MDGFYGLYHLGTVSESSDEGNCYQAARSVTIGRMDYGQGLSRQEQNRKVQHRIHRARVDKNRTVQHRIHQAARSATIGWMRSTI